MSSGRTRKPSGDSIVSVVLVVRTSPEQQRRAALVCAQHATDPDDLIDLLHTLGLDGGR